MKKIYISYPQYSSFLVNTEITINNIYRVIRLIAGTRLRLRTKITIEIFLSISKIFFRPKCAGYLKHLINGVYGINKKKSQTMRMKTSGTPAFTEFPDTYSHMIEKRRYVSSSRRNISRGWSIEWRGSIASSASPVQGRQAYSKRIPPF